MTETIETEIDRYRGWGMELTEALNDAVIAAGPHLYGRGERVERMVNEIIDSYGIPNISRVILSRLDRNDATMIIIWNDDGPLPVTALAITDARER